MSKLALVRTARRSVFWMTCLAALLSVVGMAAVLTGPVPIPPTDSLAILAHHLFSAELPEFVPRNLQAIVWEIRAPRVVLGAAVGTGLAVAGTVLQALVRNMLADPYVVGVNSGASAGAAAAVLFGAGAAFGEFALQGSAFLGALGAATLVFVVAHSAGRLTSVRLLLSGVAVGYALSAVTSFLVFASDSAEGTRSVMFWLLGSLGLAAWDGALLVVVAAVAVVAAALTMIGPRLDALGAGDETALTLGIQPDRLRAVLLLGACLLVGVIVAMAGSIGFVGLVVPHLARRLVGGRHRLVVPTAALLGASLLVAADVVARTLLAPQEVPIGIITALLGAPFLLVLVRRLHAQSVG